MQTDTENEQLLFYEKIASYVKRHPEFIEELQRRIEIDERYSSERIENAEKVKGSTETKGKKKAGFLQLDEERINTISEELSEMLFDRDKTNKSILEKTVQDAFAGAIRGYLSKYAG